MKKEMGWNTIYFRMGPSIIKSRRFHLLYVTRGHLVTSTGAQGKLGTLARATTLPSGPTATPWWHRINSSFSHTFIFTSIFLLSVQHHLVALYFYFPVLDPTWTMSYQSRFGSVVCMDVINHHYEWEEASGSRTSCKIGDITVVCFPLLYSSS